MDVTATMSWMQAVRGLQTHADVLSSVRFPRLLGKAGAVARAELALGTALRDTATAAQLLERANAPTAVLEDARAAVELLGTAPMDAGQLRSLGRRLSTFVDAAERSGRQALRDEAISLRDRRGTLDAAEQARFQQLIDLDMLVDGSTIRAKRPDELTREDWADLAGLIREGDPSVAKLPRTIDGAAPFDEWLAGLQRGEYRSSDDVERYFAQWRMAESPPEELRALATRLRDSDARTLSAGDWRDLAALRSVDGTLVGMPDTLPHAASLDEWLTGLPTGTYTANGEVERYLASWRVKDMSAADRLESLGRLRDTAPSTLTRQDWALLDALVRSDDAISIPRTIPGVRDLDELLPAITKGDATAAEAATYVRAWKLADASPQELRSIARRLRDLDVDAYTTDDWAELVALRAQRSGSDLVRMPDSLTGASDLDEWLPGLASGRYTNNGELHRYVASWRVAEMPAAERASTIARIRETAPDALTKQDWATLDALVRTDDAITIPRTIPGMTDLDELLPALAKGDATVSEAGAYFRAWKLGDSSPDELQAMARRLRDLDPNEMTADDWAELVALRAHASGDELVRVPGSIPGASDLDEWLPGLASGRYTNNGELDRYFAAWRIADMPAAERTAAASRLRDMSPADLTKQDWALLDALVRSDTSIRIPRSMPGMSDLDEWLPGLVTGKYTANDELAAYFQSWRLSDATPAELRAKAHRLRDLPLGDYTREDWSELAALLGNESSRTYVKVPQSLAGASDLSEWLPGLISGKYTNNGELDRFIAAWRMADSKPADIRAMSTRLRDMAADDYTTQDWALLSALIETEAGRKVTKIPRTMPGASDLDEWLPGLVTGKYTNNGELDRYLEAWRLADTPPEELRAMGRRLRDMDANDFTKQDWVTLSTLLAVDGDRQLVTIPRSLTGASDLSEWLPGLISGKYTNNGELDRYLVAWRMQDSSPDELQAMARLLRDRNADDYTSADWAQLAALVDADDTTRAVSGLPRQIPGTSDLSDWLPGLITGKFKNNGELDRYIEAWRFNDDPAHRARLEAAVDAVANGSSDAESIRLVGSAAHRMAELVEGRPIDQQAAIAAVMLELDSVAGNRGVKSVLEGLRPQLAAIDDLDAGLVPLREDTLRLIDDNLARLDGRTPSGQVVGYSNHPDYAEIGRIRANAQLITRARTRPPEAAGPSVATPTNTALERGPGPQGETLSW